MAGGGQTLGVIAGAGTLPRIIIDQALADSRSVFVAAFDGHTQAGTVAGVPHIWSRLGRAGAVVRAFRRNGVGPIVMAGAIRRPTLAELRPDWYTARFFALNARTLQGDDGILRAIARLLETEGFSIVGASELVSQVLAPQGLLGVHPVPAGRASDIERGVAVVRALGMLDVGQAAVVQQGFVLGVEGVEGTDALIARTGALKRGGAGPILVKLVKPGQDTRLDLPTLGPQTVTNAAAAGFAGIVVEAGRTILLEAEHTAALADRQGLFLNAIVAAGSITAGPVTAGPVTVGPVTVGPAGA